MTATAQGIFDIHGTGMVSKQVVFDGKVINITFENALHTPGLSHNLMSIGRLDRAGCYSIFGGGGVTFVDKHDRPFMRGKGVGTMYEMEIYPVLVPIAAKMNTASKSRAIDRALMTKNIVPTHATLPHTELADDIDPPIPGPPSKGEVDAVPDPLSEGEVDGLSLGEAATTQHEVKLNVPTLQDNTPTTMTATILIQAFPGPKAPIENTQPADKDRATGAISHTGISSLKIPHTDNTAGITPWKEETTRVKEVLDQKDMTKELRARDANAPLGTLWIDRDSDRTVPGTTSTSLSPDTMLTRDTAPETAVDHRPTMNKPYWKLLGLITHTCTAQIVTHPGLSLATSTPGPSKPGSGQGTRRPHWNAPTDILHYLKGTLNHGTTYKHDPEEYAEPGGDGGDEHTARVEAGGVL